MSDPVNNPLAITFRALILALDKDNVLTQDTVKNMVRSLQGFTVTAIQKFIKGQKEHGGKITDRRLMEELGMEQIDSFWYGPFGAMSWPTDSKDDSSTSHHD